MSGGDSCLLVTASSAVRWFELSVFACVCSVGLFGGGAGGTSEADCSRKLVPKAAFQEMQLVADLADFYTRIGTGDYLYGPGQPLGVGDLDVDGKVRPEFPQSRLRVGGRDWLRGSRERACVWERERECVRYVEGGGEIGEGR